MATIYVKLLVFLVLLLGGGLATEARLRDADLKTRVIAHLSALIVVVFAFLAIDDLVENFTERSSAHEAIGFEEKSSSVNYENEPKVSTSEIVYVPDRDEIVRETQAPDFIIDHRNWLHLNRGQRDEFFEFTVDGRLLFRNSLLAKNIPVTGVQGGDGSHWIYAQSLSISPISPSGEFVIFYGCEGKNQQGLCWASYLARLSNLQVERLRAGLKYGINEWVAWFNDFDETAIVRSGEANNWRVHLPTGNSEECSISSCSTSRKRH